MLRPTFSTLKRRAFAGLSVLAIASATLVPVPAFAEPVNTTGGAKGCVVENVDANGNTVSTSTVPEGTRIGLFYCHNGEWRFGTVVLDLKIAPPPTRVATTLRGATTVLATSH
jgi:hypothetical protein